MPLSGLGDKAEGGSGEAAKKPAATVDYIFHPDPSILLRCCRW
jgi:hypothetical protein